MSGQMWAASSPPFDIRPAYLLSRSLLHPGLVHILFYWERERKVRCVLQATITPVACYQRLGSAAIWRSLNGCEPGGVGDRPRQPLRALSPFIKEKKGYCVGIFDTLGRLVCCHLSQSGPGMITPILEVYSIADMRPGDVYWYNDPYLSRGAVQHHQDMVFAVPVFYVGHAVAFSVTYGHYQDLWGVKPGSISPQATEIFHEGTLVPPIRIYRQGRLNEEAYRIFLRNSRLPHMVEGDTKAMIASCRVAERRLLECDIPPTSDGIKLRRGDLLRLMTCGGGGWGDPYGRDPALVQQDVARGFVSVLGALEDYGVVLDHLTLELDKIATEELREDRPSTPQLFDRGPTFAQAEAEWYAKHP